MSKSRPQSKGKKKEDDTYNEVIQPAVDALTKAVDAEIMKNIFKKADKDELYQSRTKNRR